MSSAAPLDPHWRLRYILLAPHRLGFSLAAAVLIAASLWWALVQVDRATGAFGLPTDGTPPLITHAALMSFGFIPLFFSGFLFTAGPKWLDVEPLSVRQIQTPLFMQCAGWLVWLLGGLFSEPLGLLGLAVAWLGLVWMSWLYAGLVRASRAANQMHGKMVRAAFVVGCVSVAGLGLSLLLQRYDLALAWVLTGLWGFVGVVFMTVAHRMIPFFTHGKLPGVEAWRPAWVMGVLALAVGAQAVFVWLSMVQWPVWLAMVGLMLRTCFELLIGVWLIWLTVRWGLMTAIKIPLLGMLHIGFLWLGLTQLIAAATDAWSAVAPGAPVWHLAALHAFTMGCLGSLMVAMVSRVAAGHSGRPLEAGPFFWGLFLLLQVTVVIRVVAALPMAASTSLLALAAVLWLAIMAAWGGRLLGWWGRVRIDGHPG
ncbi:NnrS family protein [Comamonas sp. SCN 65-56]|uniref:NnrS family protein n=1 Tax=Comamonas sp. SCN 65-56 TaxID=1660095 RepID=UPI0025C2F2A6|nr:NnrS family protein [Comamonas sp. SCN 65-56]